MIHSYLFQCYAKCCKNFACESTRFLDFLEDCLCYLGKFLCVSASLLLFIFLTIILFILLTWATKWVKVKLHITKIRHVNEVECFEKLSEINRTISNLNAMKTPDISDVFVLIYIEGLLEIMNAAITNYYKDGVSAVQKKHEMLTFHKALLCLQICQKSLGDICNLQIDKCVKLLSECLDTMIDSKNEKDKKRDEKNAEENNIQKFMRAKESVRKTRK